METVIINGKQYYLDIEKAKSQGLLQEKLPRPISWREYCAQEKHDIDDYDSFNDGREIQAFHALGKLIQLRDAWWGDWRPGWSKDEEKYGICVINNAICKGSAHICQFTFVFPTDKMRNEFFNTFYDLIEQAKMFL